MLKEHGYSTGDCLSLTLSDRQFRMFFARSGSGEMYEFISVGTGQGRRYSGEVVSRLSPEFSEFVEGRVYAGGQLRVGLWRGLVA